MERIASLGLLEKHLSQNPRLQCIIIADGNTLEHCLPNLIYNVGSLSEAQIIELEPGENSKDLGTYQSIIEALMEQGADRDTKLIALGGGVVCDIANFVAGTFKRGIGTYLIPTTTLAMVDAAIGGKCGLNVRNVKNQIGLFHEAELVCINNEFLKTLPARQIENGAVEMLKTALISDKALALAMMQTSPLKIGTDRRFIKQCIKIKQNIVKQDKFDRFERKLLNFGHTIGHAIESLALENGKDLLHGEAVASGMYYAATLSKDIGVDNRKLLQNYLSTYYEIEKISDAISELFDYMNNDKKNKNGHCNFVLLEDIGKGIYDQVISKEDIIRAIS